MSTEYERREYDRLCSKTLIMYAKFIENQFSFYGAKMHNCCAGGMYFETDYPVRKGMIVSIRRADYSADCKGVSTYTEHRAEVKWYKAIRDADKPYYGVGVKFSQPVGVPPFFQNGS